MADIILNAEPFITPFTKEEIVEAISKSLLFNPDTIGCLRVDSTASTPKDVQTLTTPGCYLIDYWTSGPVDSLDKRPMLLQVYYINTTTLAQTATIGSAVFTCTYENSLWTSWKYNGGAVTGVSAGTGDALTANIPSFVLVDMIPVILRLHTAIMANATLKINAESAYPIYKSTGEPITAGEAQDSTLFLVYNASNQRFYTIGGASGGTGTGLVSSDLVDKIHVDADGTGTLNTVSGSKVTGAISGGTAGALTAGSKTFNGTNNVTLTAGDLGALTSADLTSYVTRTNFATTSAGGVVKSSADKNNVSVDAFGIMTVNNIDASKIEGGVSRVANSLSFNGDVAAEYNGSEAKTITIKNKAYQISNLSQVPTDTDRFWIDENGGQHYYDGTAWKPVTPLWG